MSKKLRELQAKKAAAAQAKAAALNSASAVFDKAATENRDLNDAEKAEFDQHKAAANAAGAGVERIQAQIDLEQELLAANAQAGSVIVLPGSGADLTVTDNVAVDPRRGFKSSGEYFKSVFAASSARQTGSAIDNRLLIGAAAPATYGSEGVGADGGFAIPPEFAKEIFTLSLTDNALLPYCDDVPIDGNSMSFPKDETVPWGSDGIRAYWQGEAAAGTPTKPALGLTSLRLKKLMALVPVSDELLADTSALSTYLPKKVGASIQWKTNEAILFGLGGATPAGTLNSGAAIVVAKESAQATLTLLPANLANMIARLPEGSYPNSVWIINNDALPYVMTMALGNYPVYFPIGAGQGPMQGNPYGTLLGRPIIVSQHAKSFTAQGDVNLVDLSYYQAITKAGGIETATSMHLYFDADAAAFRTIFRMDGQSKISKAISPNNGTNKLSPFVQLGAR